MKKETLDFGKKWNSLSDEKRWELLLESKDALKVFLYYDDITLILEDPEEDLYLDFDEVPGCISGIYVLLTKLGVPCEYIG